GAQTQGGSISFAPLGERLRCELDAGTMRCVFRIPLLSGAQAEGNAAAATQSLTCRTTEDLGIEPFEFEGEVLCFVGTFPNVQGLGAGEMASGQITLPARGDGVVRNIIVSMSDQVEDLGVCKGGSNPGAPCDRSDDNSDCQDGGSCAEGICASGTNQGQGCDQATAT